MFGVCSPGRTASPSMGEGRSGGKCRCARTAPRTMPAATPCRAKPLRRRSASPSGARLLPVAPGFVLTSAQQTAPLSRP
jgi:hypothetical protein